VNLFLLKSESFIKKRKKNKKLLLTKKILASSSLGGFKKTLFNSVQFRDGVLFTPYHKKNQNHSHYGISQYELRKLAKCFGYFSQNKVRFFVAETLKQTYGSAKSKSKVSLISKSVPNLVDIIETQCMIVLTRNQRYFSFFLATKCVNKRQRQRKTELSCLDLSKLCNQKNVLLCQGSRVIRQGLKRSETNRRIVPWLNIGSVQDIYS
jgi:hypothetical protein